ncbi:hypothetical protein PYCCODRAFT_377720 [Trametes coccinea BRFM310]|uniref:Uncharacterized protein n=1 Tax=Trametes coccinea (strain BRFM310) TaxID=1353009 RepID=A0A1Y2J537_TRAC3|nr:hypothetical protein PYCCODRAFT_377720 [Trametes coccinea BRFM310]
MISDISKPTPGHSPRLPAPRSHLGASITAVERCSLQNAFLRARGARDSLVITSTVSSPDRNVSTGCRTYTTSRCADTFSRFCQWAQYGPLLPAAHLRGAREGKSERARGGPSFPFPQ